MRNQRRIHKAHPTLVHCTATLLTYIVLLQTIVALPGIPYVPSHLLIIAILSSPAQNIGMEDNSTWEDAQRRFHPNSPKIFNG
jgi:hypothetical protein